MKRIKYKLLLLIPYPPKTITKHAKKHRFLNKNILILLVKITSDLEEFKKEFNILESCLYSKTNNAKKSQVISFLVFV